jgi:hypothetical protein
MYCLFRNINFHLLSGGKDQYSIIIAIFDKEINKINNVAFTEGQDYTYNLLVSNSNQKIKEFLSEIKITIMMDYNFMIHQTLLDSKYFQADYKQGGWTFETEEQKQVINTAIKNTISCIQKELQTNEINIEDFITKIAKQTDKSKPWLYWESLDENQNKIEFYAPNYNTEVTTLAT